MSINSREIAPSQLNRPDINGMNNMNISEDTHNNTAGSAQSNRSNVAQTLSSLNAEDPSFNRIFHLRHMDRGQVVATASDLAHKMYVLMNGKVNMVCTNNEGRRLVIATLENGAVFGQGALEESRDKASIFVEAATSISVWTIPEDDARNLTMQYPILGWGLLQTYGERLLQVENSLEDVAYKKLPERLAALLLDMNDYVDGTVNGISHQALADHLGTYRETVSAILRDFKRQGFVELGYRRINILDSENLKDIAGIWEY